MPWAAAAAVVAAGISASASNKASKENAKGIQKGLDQSAALAQQARQDVMALFDRSTKASNMSMEAMLDYYKTAAPKRVSPYLQGNMQAQNVIGLGAQQANNAILGLPTDMSFVNQPQIVPGTDHLQAGLPDYSQIPAMQQEEVMQAEAAQQKAAKDKGYLTGGGIFRAPNDKKMLDPKERLENPLGLSQGLSDKLNPKNVFKKLV